eukprot:FR735133.1.p1 GENE.FR735133.1~~FR735133.1.p1  ORF type:complete len:193 (+),score=18.47 FR735133.1:147-725(+)
MTANAPYASQHAFFLLSQIVLLMGICSLVGVPQFSRALITATIYCCSRRQPSQPMEVQFGLRIEYWLLPYVNMIVDILQAQSIAGAVPHVLGIFTGHVYHFFTVIWPEMGGKRYLTPPKALTKLVEKTEDSKPSSKPKGFKIEKQDKSEELPKKSKSTSKSKAKSSSSNSSSSSSGKKKKKSSKSGGNKKTR